MKITGNGNSVWNPQAGGFGIAIGGQGNNGSIEQYNNGKADTRDVGSASKNGSIHSVLCTDGIDTVQLGQGWTNAGYQVDDASGIGGILYTSATGDQLLISGGAQVKDPDKPLAENHNNHNGNLNDQAKSTLTLTTDHHFEDVAGDDNQISLKDAQDAYNKAPDGPLKDALKWLTTDGHYEQLSGGSDKTISLKQLQDAYIVSSGSE